jgi:hypothetical protein
VTPTALDLQAHARQLAAAFDVRLIEAPVLKPEEALCLSHLRVALCHPIIDETTYAVALHEMGHLASPTGVLRSAVNGDIGRLMRDEEDAAWTWARHYALIWTPAMQAVATWAEGTYAPRPATSTTPEPARKQINWKDWK